MVSKTKKKLTPVQQEYQALAKKREPSKFTFKNLYRAFLVGGLICLIGEIVQQSFVHFGGYSVKEASSPTVGVMILISVILTCFGVYDKIAQWAGAGTAVPVTGFANAMASAAIEYRRDGIVLGIGGSIFKVAGPVIVFGTVAAFAVGIAYVIFDPNIVGG
ncbi:stage V sporulation protein AC [Paenibacillus chibensis]|uniref:Stage V sporulation protein AC n=1 Tax=Paenibacillus chibensis TaxID=59846 RepID=A0ABU6PNH7_9BACL|nr:stage V sporulation protein AC [Paenibacillus chibensis]MEC0369219.1 stage V sporulation protein AC [Paenibacillus chibensis]MED5015731.1 stage V sporulation protein AC [Paenibacillus chibensis]